MDAVEQKNAAFGVRGPGDGDGADAPPGSVGGAPSTARSADGRKRSESARSDSSSKSGPASLAPRLPSGRFKDPVYAPALAPYHAGPAGKGGGRRPAPRRQSARAEDEESGASGAPDAGAGGGTGGAGGAGGQPTYAEEVESGMLPYGLRADVGVVLARPPPLEATPEYPVFVDPTKPRPAKQPDRRLNWSDDNGYALFQVFYSDNLHYSGDQDYDDYGAGGGCCVVS